MDGFEMTVLGERWRIAERRPGGATPTYDFTWVNGPDGGSYGFTVGGGQLTRERLIAEVVAFVDDFSEPGGIGEDFAAFVPARFREG